MHVLAYALPTTLLCGTLLLAVYLLFAGVCLSASGVSLMVLLAIGAAEILLQPLFAFLSNEHLAMERIARSQVVISLPLVMRLLAASLVFMVDAADPLAAFSFGYLIASAIALSLATATSSAPWPTLRDWRLPSRSELHQSSGYAALAFTACGPGEIDKTLAAVLLTPSSSGLYAAGTRVIGAVTLPVIAMLLSALPRLFREGHTQPRETTRLLRWILVAALLYSALITAVLWLAAPVFMGLFGPGYEGISQMIQWLCLAVPGMALRIAAGSMLMALGRPWMRAGFEIAGVIVLLVCSLMLTGRLGGTGMAVALACAEWTMAALGLALIASARMRAIRPRAA